MEPCGSALPAVADVSLLRGEGQVIISGLMFRPSLPVPALVGKKQDLWYVVDLLTGEKQQTLTSSFAEMLCPSSSLLYLGRTGD